MEYNKVKLLFGQIDSGKKYKTGRVVFNKIEQKLL
jgi:hypothetical protein